MIGINHELVLYKHAKKPKKIGIKVWVLCEFKTDYCLQLQIYTRKSQKQSSRGVLRKRFSENMQQIYRRFKRAEHRLS